MRPAFLAILRRLLWLLSLVVLILLLSAPPPTLADEISPQIGGFRLISENGGWLVFGGRLYWGNRAGDDWSDITPAAIGQDDIRQAFFMDGDRGWLILSRIEQTGAIVYEMARTVDRGQTWQIQTLDLFESPREPSDVSAVYLEFNDPQVGWMAIKQATSSNFSVGTLFRTLDGGATWERLSLPIGAPVSFVDRQLGWTVGGADESQLYRTINGGQTWGLRVAVDPSPDPASRVHYQMPVFESPLSGTLAVTIADLSGSRVDFYITHDGGATWLFQETIDIGLTPIDGIFVTIASPVDWTINVPSTGKVWQVIDGALTSSTMTGDPAFAGINEFGMVSPRVGWAKAVIGECQATDNSTFSNLDGQLECSTSISLLQTADAGQTWAAVPLPDSQVALQETFEVTNTITQRTGLNIAGLASRTQVFSGQGFDNCMLPSSSQMQTWFTSSPYRVWNLYIGGSSRAACGTLTASFIAQLAQQGWNFIPTWVGPQAACSGFASKMNPDPATAFSQGVAEANSAVEAAASLGLTQADKSGTIIYYDLESYNTADATCRDAAKAFISGWSGQLRSRSNQAGVYGSACSSALADFAGISNVPDAVWIAAWLIPYQYRSDASVWNVSCLANNLWANQQRMRQYAGGHSETWGAVSLNIDSNIIGGIVATANICPQSGAVFLYFHRNLDCNGQGQDSGYTGRATAGWQNITGVMNNNASSAYIPSGWSVRIFDNADRNAAGGGSVCLNAGQAGIMDFSQLGNYPGTAVPINDTASSFEVFTTSCLSPDEFATPKQITNLPFTDSLDSSTATPYQDDPAFTSCNSAPGLATVWYRYTPAASGRLSVDTLGSNYDTVLGVWTGNRGSLSAVTCNDNAQGGQQSSLTAPVSAGTPYYIEVAAFNGLIASGVNATEVKPEGVSAQSGGLLSLHVSFQAGSAIFADVPVTGKEWMQPWIEKFSSLGLTTGCATNPVQFCPEREVTRAEMAVFLLRALHLNQLPYTPPPASGTFSDVPVSGKEWMEPWIEEFYAKGITTGCAASPLQYCPERNVTRAEMAVFVLRAKYYVAGTAYTPPAASHLFGDMPVVGKEWMEDWVDEFSREGITTGCGAGQFCPERNVTRAEMAVFILRAFGWAP